MAKTRSSNPLAARYSRVGSDSLKQRIVAASVGEAGALKTSFWLSAPGPILVQSTDQGLEGVIDVPVDEDVYGHSCPFNEAKDIYVEEYDPNTTDREQEEAEEIRGKFEEDFEYAITHGVRTIVWDKESQVYDIFKYAEFGAPSDAPSNYYPLFQRYRKLIAMAKASDVNFGIIQGMKTPWVPKVNKNSGKTGAQAAVGTRVPRGMPEIEELVHINLHHFVGEGGEFQMAIGKSRGPGGQNIQNTTIPYMAFKDFAQLVFPGTKEGDWR